MIGMTNSILPAIYFFTTSPHFSSSNLIFIGINVHYYMHVI